MKATKILGRLIVGCLFACCLTLKLHAQPTLPPPDTNNYDGGTNTPVDYAAIYSNNLASVSCWLHCGITNSDGTPADSMQDYADLQASAFSTTASATAIQQQSVRDEALTWATANGIPTELMSIDGTTATLVSREGNVPNYLSPCDIASDITINTTNVWPGGSTGFNLTGTNTTISQWDEGLPRPTHTEFGGRVTELDGYTNLSDHSTAVAGMIAAAGANIIYSNGVPIGYAAKGMAYTAQVQSWSYNDNVGDLAGMAASLGTNHMRLSNHSYEFTSGWYFNVSLNAWEWLGYWQIGSQDPRFGNYTANTANYDAVTVGAPTYLQVWAAGNEQNYAPPVQPTNHYEFTLAGALYVTNAVRAADGDQGGYDTLSQNASAKDNLTVGAINPLGNGFTSPTNVTIATFSSLGPTDDGRIKPDVVADGVNNIVAVSSSDYAYGQGSGTSFAAPSVTGSIDLLTQFYKQFHTNSSDLLASTLKGLVIHTADSCTTNNGPSYKFGWGVMNTKTAGTLINQDATNGLKNQIKEVLLNNGQFIQFPVVSAGSTNNPLKVTICWTDPVGAPNAITNLDNPAIKLVNDLDLRIVSPGGTTNFPWILNPDLTNRTSAARSAAATTGDDNRNNVEQVYIPNPTNGTYTVNVTHKGSLTNSQWVSILISGNVAQSPPPLTLQAPLQTGTNTMAVGWPAVVGEQYQLTVNTNLATTNWVSVGGIISARLTNVVTQVPMSGSQAFYRVIQLP
jgi:hypothetical protein